MRKQANKLLYALRQLGGVGVAGATGYGLGSHFGGSAAERKYTGRLADVNRDFGELLNHLESSGFDLDQIRKMIQARRVKHASAYELGKQVGAQK